MLEVGSNLALVLRAIEEIMNAMNQPEMVDCTGTVVNKIF